MKVQGEEDNEGKTQWLVTREGEKGGVKLKHSTVFLLLFLFCGFSLDCGLSPSALKFQPASPLKLGSSVCLFLSLPRPSFARPLQMS